MESKKTASSSPASASGAAQPSNPDGLTPERFEKELKDLASKAQSNTFSARFAHQVAIYLRVATLLALLAVSSHASQLNLSPVYGSIPASIWHSKLLMAGCFLGWAGNLALRDALPISCVKALPIIVVCVPGLQHWLGTYSGLLGPQWGPVVTEAVTLLPVSILTAASAADYWEEASLTFLPKFVADAGPGIGSWALFKVLEGQVGAHIHGLMGTFVVFTRLGLEIALSFAYMLFSPSKYLVYTAFPFFHTFLLNMHVPSQVATANLISAQLSDNWLLINRRESVTGYLSVFQSVEKGFRAMRCDHSLLGGEWINHRGGPVSEPIYGVFAMLEAVRLAERSAVLSDKDAKALVMYVASPLFPSSRSIPLLVQIFHFHECFYKCGIVYGYGCWYQEPSS